MTKKKSTKRVTAPWTVHPNRFEDATVIRSTSTPRAAPIAVTEATSESGVDRADMTDPCVVVLPLPKRYRRRRTAEGNIVIEGDTWWEAVGTLQALAATVDETAPSFGIKFPWEPLYRWWDGTTTAEDLLAGPDAAEWVKLWLEHIYPDATGPIQVIDQRPVIGIE